MGTSVKRIFAVATSIATLSGCGSSPTAPAQPLAGSVLTKPAYAGTYELTFAASPDCNRDWWGPAFIPSRTYRTTLSGTEGWAYLSPGSFTPTGGSFQPFTHMNALSFSIRGDVVRLGAEDPQIEERDVPGLGLFSIYFEAEGTLTDPLTELQLVGDFADCYATNHRLTLRHLNP
jgi:hypothetical protein